MKRREFVLSGLASAAYAAVPRSLKLRMTLGDDIGLLHDVHERITPNQAVALAQDHEAHKLFYLEDPRRPEHVDTFRLIRQRANTPIAMGEVYVGLWTG